MDQYPFEIKITLVGYDDIEDFIELLRLNGFNTHADEAEKQMNEQLT